MRVPSVASDSDQSQLERAARDFLTDHAVRAETRLVYDGSEPGTGLPAFWPAIAELGWLAVHLPEELGGAGGSLLDLGVVVQELGRALAPGPYLPTAIASAILSIPGWRGVETTLSRLADGSATAAVALWGSAKWDDDSLVGDVGPVLGGPNAGCLLVAADRDLVLVDLAGGLNPPLAVTGTDRSLPTGRWVPEPGRLEVRALGRGMTEAAMAIARALAGAEAVGGAGACVEMSVTYAGERIQFGRVIGSFQAVKHRCADMFVRATLASAAAWEGCRQAGEPVTEAGLAGARAVALSLPAYLRNAQDNIQVHGGIGYTWEHDAHLYLRRAAALYALFSPRTAALEVARARTPQWSPSLRSDLGSVESIREEAHALAVSLARRSPGEQRQALVEGGYAQPHWPRPWGRDAGAAEQVVIAQELAGLAQPDYGVGAWVIPMILAWGTVQQIEGWIGPSTRGELVWCQMFSEPDAGSDAAAISTTATRVPGGWRVSGQKVWTSNAERCHRGLTTVRTEIGVSKRQGITMMVVDLAAPGVKVRPIRDAAGGYRFNEIFLDDVFVPDDAVLGPVGQGWKVARATLGSERVSVGAADHFGGGAVDLASLLPSSADDGLAANVGAVMAEGDALSLLGALQVERTLSGHDGGADGDITKLVRGEHIQRTVDAALDLLPPTALLDTADDAVASHIVQCRMTTIAGGTSEITRNQIAERILGLPREPGLT